VNDRYSGESGTFSAGISTAISVLVENPLESSLKRLSYERIVNFALSVLENSLELSLEIHWKNHWKRQDYKQ
jgi:hypothetical protein